MRSIAVAERAASRVYRISVDHPAVTVRLAVRLESPGDPCVNLTNDLQFSYEPGLPESAQEALDRRLYDAIYTAVDFGDRPLPVEGLNVIVTTLTGDPPFGTILADDPAALTAIGDALAALLSDAVRRARRELPE